MEETISNRSANIGRTKYKNYYNINLFHIVKSHEMYQALKYKYIHDNVS